VNLFGFLNGTKRRLPERQPPQQPLVLLRLHTPTIDGAVFDRPDLGEAVVLEHHCRLGNVSDLILISAA
jgi:hypothetical protein